MSELMQFFWQVKISSRSNHALSLVRDMHLFRENEVVRPVYNLFIGIVCVLRAEWWVADDALVHDGTK